MGTALLVTSAASPFAELARWALELARLPFREEPHLPVLQTPSTLARSGNVGAVSLLLPGGRAVDDAVDVVRLADDALGGALLARGRPERREVLELEAHFLNTLGPDARRLFYGCIFPDRQLVLDTIARDVPRLERAAFAHAHRTFLRLVRTRLDLGEEALARSEARLHEVFAATDARVQGRVYLVGDGLTAADLALAALASPVILPEQLGGARVPLDRVPDRLRATIEALRGTRTGAFVRALYATHRHPLPQEQP